MPWSLWRTQIPTVLLRRTILFTALLGHRMMSNTKILFTFFLGLWSKSTTKILFIVLLGLFRMSITRILLIVLLGNYSLSVYGFRYSLQTFLIYPGQSLAKVPVSLHRHCGLPLQTPPQLPQIAVEPRQTQEDPLNGFSCGLTSSATTPPLQKRPKTISIGIDKPRLTYPQQIIHHLQTASSLRFSGKASWLWPLLLLPSCLLRSI
jgi:hypothetical protein